MADSTHAPQVSDKDRLLSMIQSNFPVCAHPYDELASRLGLPSGEVAYALLQDLIGEKVVRRLGAIFDSAHVGYRSSLCALAVTDPADMDAAVKVVNAYPNVTHNYERPGHYNMWFTVTAPSELAIKVILQEIAARTGYDDVLYLPALRLFKIRVDFDLTGERPAGAVPPVLEPGKIVVEDFSSLDKELVRLLQEDLGHTLEPYAYVAQALTDRLQEELGYPITQDVVLQRIRNWKFNGTIRRFGAAVRHRTMGFSHNAMGVWDIPDELVPKVGAIMAAQPEVSHCYERPRQKTWPYNFYTMIHGTSPKECEAVAQRIVEHCAAQGISVEPVDLLYSTREFKKVSMRYFVE